MLNEWSDSTHARPTGAAFVGGNSQWHNQYRELEAPVPIVLQAVHRGLSGQSVSLEKREFDIRLWGFRAIPALLM